MHDSYSRKKVTYIIIIIYIYICIYIYITENTSKTAILTSMAYSILDHLEVPQKCPTKRRPFRDLPRPLWAAMPWLTRYVSDWKLMELKLGMKVTTLTDLVGHGVIFGEFLVDEELFKTWRFFTCPPIEERWLQQMIIGICRLFALFMLQGSVNL